MTQNEAPTRRNPATKALVSAAIGGVIGFLMVSAIIKWTKAAQLGDSHLILAGVGGVYFLIGLIVGLGTIMPKAGAQLLNVEDRGELVEQRSGLLSSSLVNVLIGVMLIVLANSGKDGLVPPLIALTTVALTIIVGFVVTWSSWKHYDELMRQVSWEASTIGFGLVTITVLVWGSLTINGMAPPFDAFLMIALVMGMMMLGAFLAAGLRGMLNPR
ncbi:hypothetical protein GCM10023115_11650 [Pontixanthobacter gangjinensis]|uniref:Uncharacterized protein n=1 Tax=Pontixanthobacter gangjinensis TaxID=1028742 RepID=A0A6I4SKJ8_9SPHN|nr:hypothetical protein [Pontixanthobacter gangjinensis]MXO56411.1 hypothetical protein [Pontixanthobacter gangjinensis]